jgi:hypothetical protein
MSISEFLRGREPEPFSAKVERHFKKYGTVYKVAGITAVLLISGGAFDYAFAADSVPAMVTSGLDREARSLYRELLNIGRWIIAFKGGVDIIKSLGNGDMESAKKSFFSYLFTYVFLLALPHALDKVDGIFDKVTHASATKG